MPETDSASRRERGDSMNHEHFASAQDIQLQREMRRIARRSLFVRRLLSVCLILALMAIFAGSA